MPGSPRIVSTNKTELERATSRITDAIADIIYDEPAVAAYAAVLGIAKALKVGIDASQRKAERMADAPQCQD